MKRFLSAFLAILLLFGFAGCTETSDKTDLETIVPTTSIETTVPETTAPSEDIAVVVAETEEFIFIITSKPYEDGFYGQAIDIYFDNFSDKDLMVSLSSAAINGYMVTPMFTEVVTAGNRTNSAITFFTEDLTANNITEITDLEFTLILINEDTYVTEFEQTFTISFAE